jgi:hypothetical protein
MSIWLWHKQQYFSHSQRCSLISHCEHTNLFLPTLLTGLLEAMREL